MKLLKDILYKAGLLDVVGSTNIAIESVTFDSRKAEKFSLFVAVRGTVVDGHNFISKAIENGSLAIVCEEIPDELAEGVNYVKVKDSAYALGIIASNFYDNPSDKIKLIGVTGTNGKTTNVTLLFNLFRKLGNKCGLLSTVQNRIGDTVLNATHTTPDAVAINALLADMVENGCSHCFMEVSSHAIDQKRVAGLRFDVAVFTNITHDHLDYHKTFDEYIKAKKALFDGLDSDAVALYNADDKHGAIMVQNTKARVRSFALKSMADYKAKIIESHFTGLQLEINNKELWSRLVGRFNAYNLLSVYAVADILGENELDVLTEISSLEPVEGRFEYFRTDQGISAIVDYAHTPDALKNVLETIKEIRTGNEQVITVVGCGGDRDKEKRPRMANIACEFSDRVVLTSDNPRSEEPDVIIEDMKVGVEPHQHKKVLAITDRREGIKTACTLAEPGDIILVAGKGHEKYQEIKGERKPFDDMAELESALKLLEK